MFYFDFQTWFPSIFKLNSEENSTYKYNRQISFISEWNIEELRRCVSNGQRQKFMNRPEKGQIQIIIKVQNMKIAATARNLYKHKIGKTSHTDWMFELSVYNL